MRTRHSAEQIVSKLRQADTELGKGLQVPEGCMHLGICEQTYYHWPPSQSGSHPFRSVSACMDWLSQFMSRIFQFNPRVAHESLSDLAQEVFSFLNAHRAKDIIIGGIAAIAHGVARTTVDVDS